MKDELYGIMTTTVVGIQYYKGIMVGPGEEALLVREPQTQYDRWWTMVMNDKDGQEAFVICK